MTRINGHGVSSVAFASEAVEPKAGLTGIGGAQLTRKKVKEVVTELEVPFDPSVIEWRVTNTVIVGGQLRGQVVPYANPRAYTDRMNRLFTPAGWTRKYAVHTSPNFTRREDQRMVAKVFVTCEVTIFGLGSHSATGEEWADDPNAGTSAEAQAFKRACSCFGLGRYLYYFAGIWADLDERKRLISRPVLTGWATPEGWLQGLRPQAVGNLQSRSRDSSANAAMEKQLHEKGTACVDNRADLIRQIEASAEPLGKALYRALLKRVARAWNPSDIHDRALLEKTLTHMQSANRGLKRLQAALEQTGPESLNDILHSFSLTSLQQINDLEMLHQVVVALEARIENCR